MIAGKEVIDIIAYGGSYDTLFKILDYMKNNEEKYMPSQIKLVEDTIETYISNITKNPSGY